MRTMVSVKFAKVDFVVNSWKSKPWHPIRNGVI